ncbi:MAG: hypothetical protein M3360_02410, partial [Actinomycetota bacterium]|nr:hypothetical protein [Actinomycetota bacterium]
MSATTTAAIRYPSALLQEWSGRYLAGGLTAILIYAAIPGTGLLKSLLYLAIHISFFGALAAGMRAHRPT